MTTATDVVNYSRSLVNQKVTVPTNPYGGQCVAYIDHLVQHFTEGKKNLAYTDAIDCLIKASQQGLEVIYNDTSKPNLIPQPGDFFVMAVPEHRFGHIGVVVSADTTGMTTLEQNIDGYADANQNGINDQLEEGWGGYVRNNNRDYTGVIGWFRLLYTKTETKKEEKTNIQEEEDMANFVIRSTSGKQGYLAVTNGIVWGIGAISTVHELTAKGHIHLELEDGDFQRFIDGQKSDDQSQAAVATAIKVAADNVANTILKK